MRHLCGSRLLAYYQDYIDETIIPKAFRRKTARSDSSDGNAAGADSASWVADDRLASQSWIDSVFDQFQLPYRGRATVVGGWHRACKRIDEGKPVIIGILKPLGARMAIIGSAYAYAETASGERYFKVHDNWGNYKSDSRQLGKRYRHTSLNETVKNSHFVLE